jgi:hypothetical protein
MHRIEATFGGISLGAGRESAKIPPHFLLMGVSAAAILSLSCVGACLIAHIFAAEAVVAVPTPHHTTTSAEAPADFGAMIVEPEWVAKPAPPNIDYSAVGSRDAAPSANIPLPSLEAFPLEPSAKAVPRPPAAPSGKASSQPPGSEVARLENGVPLPPPRPPGLGEPAPSAAPQVVQPAAPAAAVDDRNLFQKLFGLGVPPTPATQTPGTQVASIAPESHVAGKAPSPPPPPALAATPTPGGLVGRAPPSVMAMRIRSSASTRAPSAAPQWSGPRQRGHALSLKVADRSTATHGSAIRRLAPPPDASAAI